MTREAEAQRSGRRQFRWRSADCAQTRAVSAIVGLMFALSSQAMPQQASSSPTSLTTLRHIVRHFDFEQAGETPTALPAEFYRYIAPAQGFPPFGSMRLTAEAPATGGRGTLEFIGQGGSMSARIHTSIIPVLPLADYVVSVQVRTVDLVHSRARLSAWLHDATGAAILRSRAESRLVNTNGQWTTLSVEIHGDYPEAADLVLDLQLLQPSQISDDVDGRANGALTDVKGSVWFDDVIVAHLPRVRLNLAGASNIITSQQQTTFEIMVTELTGEPLQARLRVLDIEGALVVDESFAAPRGRQILPLAVNLERAGWYRAVLDVASRTGMARQRWLDFVILPTTRQEPPVHDRFALLLNAVPPTCYGEVPHLLQALGAGRVVLPVWTARTGSAHGQDEAAQRRQLIDQLLHDNIKPILSLERVPDALCSSLGLQPSQVFAAISKDPRHWRPFVDELLVNFGVSVSRWHIGPTGNAEGFWDQGLGAAVDAVDRSLSDFVPSPFLFTSWSIEQAPPQWPAILHGRSNGTNGTHPQRLPHTAEVIVVPWHVQPHAIGHYAEPWLGGSPDSLAILQALPTDRFTPRQRMVDLALRGLYAWRSGLPTLAIDAPWHCAGDSRAPAAPDPLFAVWRCLAHQLADRTFIGELPLSNGLHCWILAGRDSSRGLVIAWCDDVASHASLQAQLSNVAVDVVDVFGNRSTVEPVDGLHRIPLTQMPVFVEGANIELVRFRGSLALDPPFLPAVTKVHEHHILLSNPWNVTITGSIRLMTDDQWQIAPSTQEFTIGPGGEARLPVRIVPQRSIVAGRKQLEAMVNVSADRVYSLRMNAEIEVGLKNIELAASWSVTPNARTNEVDLLVSQAVTNRGETTVNLDVYLLAPEVSQTRRTISGLGPGETAVRTFRIPNGAVLLAGKQLRVGVSERDGVTRLNRLLDISPRANQLHLATVTGEMKREE